MNFYNFATVQILLCAITTVHAHSHVECTKFNGQQCQGYARFYWYNKQGFEGTDQSRDRNYIVSAGLQNCPAAPAAGDPYNSDYPMATVSPGEMVELQWPPVSIYVLFTIN
jgi:hypothetical protein